MRAESPRLAVVGGCALERQRRLPLDAAAEVLVLLEPALEAFERQAALVLERAPVGGQ